MVSGLVMGTSSHKNVEDGLRICVPALAGCLDAVLQQVNVILNRDGCEAGRRLTPFGWVAVQKWGGGQLGADGTSCYR